MSLKTKFLTTFFLILMLQTELSGQSKTGNDFESLTRFDYYTSEEKCEIILSLPAYLKNITVNTSVYINDSLIYTFSGSYKGEMPVLEFPLSLRPSVYQLVTTITANGRVLRSATSLTILSHKANEVKCDRRTGGLIVNGRQFFPFGFYTYSPVAPELPAEEVVRGFNMMSPYQTIEPQTITERKAYMDRCAQLGMKVHYNLLSVSGGGGTGSQLKGLSEEEKVARLKKEVETFRDHPALLAWYISDEPNGRKVTPAELEKIYHTVKELDPWHPVSIVFMAPFTSAVRYSDAMDIAMADPYPVPDYPVAMAGQTAEKLSTAFAGKKPVWIVPQAFGGGELWRREPTIQELRSMTWQAIVKGARGIQYFVRQGPNYFPKSVPAWNECGRIAMEVAELTPWLLSGEEALTVRSSGDKIIAASFRHEGKLAVLAVNTSNEPLPLSLTVAGAGTGSARVLFENRNVLFSGGNIRDFISSYGTQAYIIDLPGGKANPMPSGRNLITDPGFENLSSPGFPSACYVRPGGDRGATAFTDSREHAEGDHSLRLITPVKETGTTIRFFPVKLNAGSTYIISLWAKADPEQRFAADDNNPSPQYAEVQIGKILHARFIPDEKWRQFVTFFTIPADTTAHLKVNLILRMTGQGVGWFDNISVIEEN